MNEKLQMPLHRSSVNVYTQYIYIYIYIYNLGKIGYICDETSHKSYLIIFVDLYGLTSNSCYS